MSTNYEFGDSKLSAIRVIFCLDSSNLIEKLHGYGRRHATILVLWHNIGITHIHEPNKNTTIVFL